MFILYWLKNYCVFLICFWDQYSLLLWYEILRNHPNVSLDQSFELSPSCNIKEGVENWNSLKAHLFLKVVSKWESSTFLNCGITLIIDFNRQLDLRSTNRFFQSCQVKLFAYFSNFLKISLRFSEIIVYCKNKCHYRSCISQLDPYLYLWFFLFMFSQPLFHFFPTFLLSGFLWKHNNFTELNIQSSWGVCRPNPEVWINRKPEDWKLKKITIGQKIQKTIRPKKGMVLFKLTIWQHFILFYSEQSFGLIIKFNT